MAPLSHPVEYAPGSESSTDTAAAEFVKESLDKDLDGLWLSLADGLLKGFAVVEVMWERTSDKKILPKEFRAVDQRRFRFLENLKRPGGWELRLLTYEEPLTGIEVPERKFIVFTFGSRDGNPYGIGLGQKLYWAAYFKRALMRYWLQHTERFASPMIAGEYPAGFSNDEINVYLENLQKAGRIGAIAVPAGQKITALTQGTTGDPYERAVRYFDEEMSKTVLGETLTTTMGQVGSYAASQTHNEVRLELAQSDAELICETLNRTIVRWIVELNCPGAEPPKMVRKVEVPADLKAEAEKDQALKAVGYQPTPERIERVYGTDYEKVQEPPPVPPGKPGEKAPAFAEHSSPSSNVDRQVDRAMAETDLSGVIDPLRKIVKDARSLEDLRDKLDHAYSELDATAFMEKMAEAFQVAAFMGRYDVLQESARK
jgi:phage gp29-like protein